MIRTTPARFLRATIFGLVLALGGATPSGAEDAGRDAEFIAGLRERHLYRLAERFCRDRLARSDLSAREEADWTVEYIVTLAQHAAAAPAEEREALWERAATLVEDFARRRPDHPRLAMVLYQGALAQLTRGELAREEAVLAGSPAEQVEGALTHLRGAIALLHRVDAALATGELRRGGAARPPLGPDEMTDARRLALQRNVRRQMARAYRNQALCHPAESPDRALALAEAIARVEPLAALTLDDPLVWLARVEAITCYRLQRDYPRVRQILEGLANTECPDDVAWLFEGERLRLAVDERRAAEARALALRVLDRPDAPPDALLAALEAIVFAWNQADTSGDADVATEMQSRALGVRQTLDALHGPYWRRRAQILLAKQSGDGNLMLQIDIAEDAFRTHRFDESLNAYDQAARTALAAGDRQKAFELARTAASIEQKRGKTAEAIARLRGAAIEFPENPDAPSLHQWAIRLAGEEALRGDETALERCVALQREHIAVWPDAASTDAARLQLGLVLENRGEPAEALDVYMRIHPTFSPIAPVIDAVQRSVSDLLETDSAEKARLDEALTWLAALIPASDAPATAWNDDAARAVLAAARLRLQYVPNAYGDVRRLVEPALRSQMLSPEWEQAAMLLLVIARAGQGDIHEARSLLAGVVGGHAARLALLEQLHAMTDAAAGAQRPALAALTLQWVRTLQADPGWTDMSEADSRRVEVVEAEALAAAGDANRGITLYAALAERYPRDRAIQTGYARLLSAETERSALTAALEQWRLVERGSHPDSDDWFEAKYQVAKLHYRLGNPAMAERMIALLAATRPELGGGERKRAFLELLSASRAAAAAAPP